jgi:RHS repeat-associated protein
MSYEFTIKDHLGNLRVAFRPGDSAAYRASMEPVLADQEEAQFDYVRETRFQTSDAAGGQHVARLNAAAGKPIGPLKMIPVRKGDELGVEAYGRYLQPVHNTHYGFSLLGFVASLLQQPTAPPAPGDGRSRVRPLPFLSIGLALVPQLNQLSNGVPKGYLRVLVFDKDSTFISSYTQQLSAAAATGYQKLNIALTAPQDGFVQAYVGNESDTDVYFDDISIRYQPTLVVQENHYDPFGLDLVGLNKNVRNNFLFNNTELQNEFGLGWNHYGARMYDAQLGKWSTTDPMSESYFSFSPYNYVRNNPLLRIDPTGQWDITVHAYKDRSKYGYGVAVVTDCNGKEVYRFNVRVEGAAGHNRKTVNADTPTGVYDIPDKDMWIKSTAGGFIAKGSKGTPNELYLNRNAYGPNPRLILRPLTGEIVDTGRDDIRTHGGRQEAFDPKTGKWVPIENPSLFRTNGCIRAFDSDMINLKAITDGLEKNNPDELGGVLKVVDDLEQRVEQGSAPVGNIGGKISYWAPGEYSADKNPEQFNQIMKDLFPNWNKK